MNTPLRRVGLAMLAMIMLLLANATYIQVVKADDYRNDPRNQRVLLEEYARQRGRIITSDEVIIANVKGTDDRLKFQRTYTNGPLYAPVTGFYSVRYGATGLERTEDEILNGSDDRLFVRRLSDLLVEAHYLPADQRVLRRLAELGASGDGVIPLTQEELAHLAGTSRATVNRVLRDGQDRGELELQRGRIQVLDASRLEAHVHWGLRTFTSLTAVPWPAADPPSHTGSVR